MPRRVKIDVTMNKPTQSDRPVGEHKPQKSRKRVREISSIDDEEGKENQSNQHSPTIQKRRSKRLQAPGLVGEVLHESINEKVLNPGQNHDCKPVIKESPSKKIHRSSELKNAVNDKLSKLQQDRDPKPTEAGCPPWSWDVAGKWTITSAGVCEVLNLKDSDALTMTIHMDNNPGKIRTGRQLWATFEFGDGCFAGTLRLCPAVDPRLRGRVKMGAFEKACSLKKDVWCGPAPNGIQKWNLRWRGIDLKTGQVEACCNDQYQTEITFDRGEDGSLTLTAVIIVRFRPVVLKGIKIGERNPKGEKEVSVTYEWLRYMPPY